MICSGLPLWILLRETFHLYYFLMTQFRIFTAILWGTLRHCYLSNSGPESARYFTSLPGSPPGCTGITPIFKSNILLNWNSMPYLKSHKPGCAGSKPQNHQVSLSNCYYLRSLMWSARTQEFCVTSWMQDKRCIYFSLSLFTFRSLGYRGWQYFSAKKKKRS